MGTILQNDVAEGLLSSSFFRNGPSAHLGTVSVGAGSVRQMSLTARFGINFFWKGRLDSFSTGTIRQMDVAKGPLWQEFLFRRGLS